MSDIVCLGATYEPTPNLIFNIESNYHGKSYLINDYYNKVSKADSYMVTNLSAKYNFNNGVSISAGVDNLFNEQYCDYIMLVLQKMLLTKNIKYSSSPERNYYIGMEYKF